MKKEKKELQKSNKLNKKRLKKDQKKNEKRSITENCIKFYKKKKNLLKSFKEV